MKVTTIGVLLAIASSQATAGWTYRQWEDQTDGSKMRSASATSARDRTGTTATLVLTMSDVSDTTVMMKISSGQFWCPKRCDIKVRFDDRLPPMTISARPADGGAYDVIFLGGERFVLEELLASKRIRVELPLFRDGVRAYEIDVKRLEWSPPAADLAPVQSSQPEGWGAENRRGQ